MISFVCPACNKQLKVKDELAGKKAKCPGCGKPIMIPENRATALSEPGKRSPVAGAATEGERTFAPSAPARAAAAAARTLPPSNQVSTKTVSGGSNKAAGDHPAELTAFLAPPRAPDEIGRLAPTEYWQCSATAAWAWSFALRTLIWNVWLP